MKRILTSEEGKVLDRKAQDQNTEGEERIVTRKEVRRLRSECEDEGLMAQKELWDMAKRRSFEDRRAVPEEEGDLVREHKAMHEDKFLSSWLER